MYLSVFFLLGVTPSSRPVRTRQLHQHAVEHDGVWDRLSGIPDGDCSPAVKDLRRVMYGALRSETSGNVYSSPGADSDLNTHFLLLRPPCPGGLCAQGDRIFSKTKWMVGRPRPHFERRSVETAGAGTELTIETAAVGGAAMVAESSRMSQKDVHTEEATPALGPCAAGISTPYPLVACERRADDRSWRRMHPPPGSKLPVPYYDGVRNMEYSPYSAPT